MMNKLYKYALALAALIALVSCAPDDGGDPPPPPPPPENSVTIQGEDYTIEQLRYEMTEAIYPPDFASEETVALRVMLQGAGLSVDLPTRLLGKKIDLTDRDTTPRPDGLYYIFNISTDDDGDDDYFDRIFYRIQSWVATENKNNDCAGWFSIDRGDESGEWIFEWELTNKKGTETISTGYINDVFEEIVKPSL
jgi:hypothetical protein